MADVLISRQLDLLKIAIELNMRRTATAVWKDTEEEWIGAVRIGDADTSRLLEVRLGSMLQELQQYRGLSAPASVGATVLAVASRSLEEILAQRQESRREEGPANESSAWIERVTRIRDAVGV